MQHGLLNSYVALFPIGVVSIGSSGCDMDLSVSHVMLFPQELVEQMLIRLDLAVAASPKLRPAVRQLVPALLGPQVNNLKMLFSFEINIRVLSIFLLQKLRNLDLTWLRLVGDKSMVRQLYGALSTCTSLETLAMGQSFFFLPELVSDLGAKLACLSK